MKRIIALLASLFLLLSLWGCGEKSSSAEQTEENDTRKQVGICLPNTDNPRWGAEGEALSAKLTELGYRVILENAADDAHQQAEQVKALLSRPVDCLVIAAVDSLALQEELEAARSANVPVLAYDRLLMNTDRVSGYVGFDAQTAGGEIARHLVQAKQLSNAQAESRSYTIELFMGPAEDHSALLFYQGVMGVLSPYFESGVLVSLSGRVAFEDACIRNWDATEAEDQYAMYISAFYPETRPDILLAASDSLATGCAEALFRTGCTEENWPYISGSGADLTAVQRLVSGQQAVTAYFNADALIAACADSVNKLLNEEFTGQSLCSNGVKDVPTCFIAGDLVTLENYATVCISGGLYTQEQIDGNQ